jgi:zinc protease
VLGGLLAGFGGLVPFDGGGGGRSSRLYRALVDGGLATEVGAGIAPSADPTLFRIVATIRSGVEVGAVEARVHEEIAKLQVEAAADDEMAKVKRQAQAQFVYVRDGVLRRAMALGAFAAVDTPARLFDLRDAIEAVTPDDVARVARTFLTERGRTVGWFVPESGASREVSA